MAKLKLKNIQASFNLADDFQRELWEHAVNRSNTSQYIKNLIIKDMLGVVETQKEETSVNQGFAGDISSVI